MLGQEGTFTPHPPGRGEGLAVGLQDGGVPRERVHDRAPHQGGGCSAPAACGETEDRVGLGLQTEGCPEVDAQPGVLLISSICGRRCFSPALPYVFGPPAVGSLVGVICRRPALCHARGKCFEYIGTFHLYREPSASYR